MLEDRFHDPGTATKEQSHLLINNCETEDMPPAIHSWDNESSHKITFILVSSLAPVHKLNFVGCGGRLQYVDTEDTLGMIIFKDAEDDTTVDWLHEQGYFYTEVPEEWYREQVSCPPTDIAIRCEFDGWPSEAAEGASNCSYIWRERRSNSCQKVDIIVGIYKGARSKKNK